MTETSRSVAQLSVSSALPANACGAPSAIKTAAAMPAKARYIILASPC